MPKIDNIKCIINIQILPKNMNDFIFKCENPSHSKVIPDGRNSTMCEGCGSNVCSKCRKRDNLYCVMCVVNDEKINGICELCEFQYEYHMCAECGHFITNCFYNCPQNEKFSSISEVILCEYCYRI